MKNKEKTLYKRYDKSFKEAAVKKFIDTPGASIAQIAKELNLQHGLFYNWVYNSKDAYLIKNRLPPRKHRQIRTETGIALRIKELSVEINELNKALYILKESSVEEIEMKIKKNNDEIEDLNKAISIVKKYIIK